MPTQRSLWRAAPCVVMLACAGDKALDPEGLGEPRETLVPEECPVPDAISRPATLMVHLVDRDGAPIVGASVVADGRGRRTDNNGDAAFFRLPEGEVVLSVVAPGQLPLSRAVRLDPGGLVRLVLTVSASPAALSFATADDLLDGAGDASLALPADAVRSISGEPYDGVVVARWMPLQTSPDEGLEGWVPSSGPTLVAPVAGATLSLSSPTGEPLVLKNTATATLRVPLELPEDLSTCGDIVAWRLDPASGRWVEHPDVKAGAATFPTGTDLVEMELPQPGDWILGYPISSACVEVTVEGCPGSDDLPLSVRAVWPSGEEIRARSELTPTLVFDDLPSGGEVALSLESAGVTLVSAGVTPVAGAACTPVTLTVPDCGGLALGLSSPGACAATSGTVRVTRDGSAETYSTPVQGLVQFPLLSAGTWHVEVQSPAGDTVYSDAMEVASGEVRYAAVEADGLEGAPPPGGCVPPPCSGSSCDACAVVSVLGDGDVPVPDAVVNAYDPVNERLSTDSDGEVCFGATDGVGADLVTYVAGVDPTRLTLTSPGSCLDASTCSAVAVRTETTCASSETPLVLAPRVLAWREPGREVKPLDPSGWPLTGSSLALEGGGDSALDALACDGDVWAATGLTSDTLGVVWSSDTRVGCTLSTGEALELDITWPEGGLGLGALEVLPASAGSTTAVAMTLRVTEADGVTAEQWTASAGALDLLSRGPLFLSLWASGTWTDASGYADDAILRLNAAVVSAADAPRGGGAVTSYRGSSMAVQAEAPLTGWSRAVVPVVVSDSTFDGGYGDSKGDGGTGLHCLPRDTLLTFQGWSQLDRLLSPFTLLSQAQATGMRSYRNSAPHADALVPSQLYWMERDLAELLYANVGVPLEQIDTMATLIGRPARFDTGAGALVTLHGFGSAVLRHPDGRTYRAVALDEELRPTSPDKAELFLFAGVAPTTIDRPYVLTLKDRGGVVVSEYTQRFAPVAGGVAVIAWPEEP